MIQSFVGVAVRVPLLFLFKEIGGGDLFIIGLAVPAATLVQVLVVGIYFFAVKKRLDLQYGGG